MVFGRCLIRGSLVISTVLGLSLVIPALATPAAATTDSYCQTGEYLTLACVSENFSANQWKGYIIGSPGGPINGHLEEFKTYGAGFYAVWNSTEQTICTGCTVNGPWQISNGTAWKYGADFWTPNGSGGWLLLAQSYVPWYG
jgi:hypothetical protein